MYWLFDEKSQFAIRQEIESLVLSLAEVDNAPSQQDQLFPFVGRKDRRKAVEIVKNLSKESDLVCEPFSGSGILAYAISQENRTLLANEYEIYTRRMASAPWRYPDEDKLKDAFQKLCNKVENDLNELYKTTCGCGRQHVLDSLFFDRKPLDYFSIKSHERLGKSGENITYRGRYKCPNCGATEKHFDDSDLAHLKSLEKRPVSKVFDAKLIENSRINLSSDFLLYKNLFPHRSMLALDILWAGIQESKFSADIKSFLEEVFLSILPQAKFKDYRSKSQDLHCPDYQLREVNLFYRFIQQFGIRLEGLKSYSFKQPHTYDNPINCLDYREFLSNIDKNSVDLVFTDPPWADGNAYFEKAQLYHPWMNYSLAGDADRLVKEMVITDAPSRKGIHNEKRWWDDMADLFSESEKVLKSGRYLALMFRPIRASKWLAILNQLKFIARSKGFEPLLTVDLNTADPSMRIQQSACFAFVDDLVMVFVKLPKDIRRLIIGNIDVDQLVFQTAEELQETLSGSFSYKQWRDEVAKKLVEHNLHGLNLPKEEAVLLSLFKRYCDEVEAGRYLTKHLTPFSSQLFDMPAVERFFTYIPKVVYELGQAKAKFTYSEFLLKLAQFVENGSRQLIQEVTELDMEKALEPYAEKVQGTKYFTIRKLPKLSSDAKKIMALDPYEFEIFIGHLLEKQGFSQIVIAGRSGDRGVDVIALDPTGKRSVIQCKQWGTNKVGSTPVQRLDSFARTRNAERKILITTSDYTPQGKDEGKITGTELINGKELGELVAKFMPEFA